MPVHYEKRQFSPMGTNRLALAERVAFGVASTGLRCDSLCFLSETRINIDDLLFLLLRP